MLFTEELKLSVFKRVVGPKPTQTSSPVLLSPTQTFLGVRHAFLPHCFPIVRKYQLVITIGAVEVQVEVLTSQTHTHKLRRV